MPLRARDPEHGQEPDQRPERQHAVAEPHRQHAAHQRHRQRAGTSGSPAGGCRTRPGAAGRSPTAAASPKTSRRSWAAFSSVDSPSTSAWYPRGNLTPSTASSTSSTTEARSRPVDVGADVDPARLQLALDRRSGSARRARRRPRAGARCPPPGVSIGSFSTSRQAVPRRGDAPDVHVVRLAAAEDVADLLARQQRRGLPADVARLEAVAPCRRQVQLHLDVRELLREVRMRRRPRRRPLRSLLRSRQPSRAARRGRGRRCARRSTRSSRSAPP